MAHRGEAIARGEDSVLDATLCFVAGGTGRQVLPEGATETEGEGEAGTNEIDALWDSGECGGFECYIAADDEDEDDEEEEVSGEGAGAGPSSSAASNGNSRSATLESSEDDDSSLLSVRAGNNMLNLVLRDEGTLRFVKFVAKGAPGSRFDVEMGYRVKDDGDDDDDDDDDDN